MKQHNALNEHTEFALIYVFLGGKCDLFTYISQSCFADHQSMSFK